MSELLDAIKDEELAAFYIDNIRTEDFMEQVKELQAQNEAPIDNDIPEIDSLCKQYNEGQMDITGLVCRIWNAAVIAIDTNAIQAEAIESTLDKFHHLVQTNDVAEYTGALLDYVEQLKTEE